MVVAAGVPDGSVDEVAAAMSEALVRVPGVVGVVLGGSRARGDALPTSDVDLGIYHDGSPDLAALSDLTARWNGERVELGGPGSWGPWVDAGAWLAVDGVAVDWILRDLRRVRQQWERASRGDYAFHPQAGHPLGFLDVSYVGELVTGVVLADTDGVLGSLRAQACSYPPALADAFADGLWEAGFLVDVARKGVPRCDTAYVGLCLTRAVMLCAHALHARAGVWVTNEKGLVPGVDRLGTGPEGFGTTAAVLGALGSDAATLAAAVDGVASLVEEVRRAVAQPRKGSDAPVAPTTT